MERSKYLRYIIVSISRFNKISVRWQKSELRKDILQKCYCNGFLARRNGLGTGAGKDVSILLSNSLALPRRKSIFSQPLTVSTPRREEEDIAQQGALIAGEQT